jgi:hypothetical protein
MRILGHAFDVDPGKSPNGNVIGLLENRELSWIWTRSRRVV